MQQKYLQPKYAFTWLQPNHLQPFCDTFCLMTRHDILFVMVRVGPSSNLMTDGAVNFIQHYYDAMRALCWRSRST
jgi:hypothetical protein